MSLNRKRPKLNDDAKFVIDTFVERGLFKNSTETIKVALELMFKIQMEKDVIFQKEEREYLNDVLELQEDTIRAKH